MSGQIRYHTDLEVWQLARRLALNLYRATAHFPGEEMYGLTRQIRRAGASVPANIAEGCGRGTTQELVRFLRVARGSLSEVDSHLTLAADLGYISSVVASDLHSTISRLHRMLNALITSVQRGTAGSGPRQRPTPDT
jgi:four helix bundle protein